MRDALLRQQDISAHFTWDVDGPEKGITAFMQGTDDAGLPTHRTLTSASAKVGTIVWMIMTRAIINQAKL